MFDSIFGPTQSERSERSIVQLYSMAATFQAALLEELQKSGAMTPEQTANILVRRNFLSGCINKTRLVDEWEDYGPEGKGDYKGEKRKEKVDKSTENTLDAIFALLNNDMDGFEKLVHEGPTPEMVEQHQKRKKDHQQAREKLLETQANCDHEKGGFFQTSTCHKCGKRLQ